MVRILRFTCITGGALLLLLSGFCLLIRRHTPEDWLLYLDYLDPGVDWYAMHPDGSGDSLYWNNQQFEDENVIPVLPRNSLTPDHHWIIARRDHYPGIPALNRVNVYSGDTRELLPELSNNAGLQQSGSALIDPTGAHIGIVYAGTTLSRSKTLYVANINGGIDSAIEVDRATSFSLWSPDGEWLYYRSGADARSNLYRVRWDGSTREQVTDVNSRNVRAEGWSPDGAWMIVSIAPRTFVVDESESFDDLFRMRPDGGDIERLTFTPTQEEQFYGWSPDGAWMYFNLVEVAQVWHIHRLNLSTGAVEQLTDAPLHNIYEGWSGDWLIYQHEDPSGVSLWRMQADGTQKQLLAEDAQFMTLSPDGEWIYYRSHPDGHALYRMRADGSDNRLLTDGHEFIDFFGWIPAADLPYRPLSMVFIGGVMLLGGWLRKWNISI